MEINISFIQVYAPTEDLDVQNKEEFYMKLSRIVEEAYNEGREIIIGGNLNATIGQDYEEPHGSMGPFGEEHNKNGNGNRLLEFYVVYRLLVEIA